MKMEDALVCFIFRLSFFSILSEKFGGNEEEEGIIAGKGLSKEGSQGIWRVSGSNQEGRLKKGKLIISVWFIVILNTHSAFLELKKYKIKGKVIPLI